MIEIAKRVAEAEPHEICFADTIGVGVPAQVTEILTKVREALPGVRLTVSFPQYTQHRHRQCICGAWQPARSPWMRASAESVDVRSRPRQPAISPPKTCCTCSIAAESKRASR